MRRTPIKRKTPLKRSQKPIARNKRPNPISEKQKIRNQQYNERRPIFLRNNPVCKMAINSNCTRVATEVHHKEGRIGDNFLNESTWLPACDSCHKHATEHSAEAIENGISNRRNTEYKNKYSMVLEDVQDSGQTEESSK